MKTSYKDRDMSLRGHWERLKYGAKATIKKPFTLFEKDGNGGWDTHATTRIIVVGGFMTEWMRYAFVTVPKLVARPGCETSDLVFHPDFWMVTMLVSIMGLEKVLDVILELKNGKSE